MFHQTRHVCLFPRFDDLSLVGTDDRETHDLAPTSGRFVPQELSFVGPDGHVSLHHRVPLSEESFAGRLQVRKRRANHPDELRVSLTALERVGQCRIVCDEVLGEVLV